MKNDSLKPVKPDTNAHRIGKFRFEANLASTEAQSVVDALKKSGAKSQRELIVLLSELYNQGRI